MALNTSKVFLMKGTSSGSPPTTTYNKLLDVKTFPNMGGDKERIDVTTLSDLSRVYIDGIEDPDELEFTANYSKTDLATLDALEGTETEFALWIGGTVSGTTVTPTGANGKFTFKGYLNAYLSGGGVNEALEMTIKINLSSPITVES